MVNNVIDINQPKKTKREKKGWSLDEIKKNARDEASEYSKKSIPEPKDLASGNMEKIIKGEDDEG